MLLVLGSADVAICVTVGVGVDRKWIIIEEGKKGRRGEAVYVVCYCTCKRQVVRMHMDANVKERSVRGVEQFSSA
jgi:hypothetical protein